MPTLTLERHCSCGGQLIVTTDTVQAMLEFDAAFSHIHSGEGHTTVTAEQAKRARRRSGVGGV
jgi:hypothetical protein